ncbi:MAG: putative FAD-linked oxidoreductase [Hyphomicrobiaceae bacterium hypho_1]
MSASVRSTSRIDENTIECLKSLVGPAGYLDHESDKAPYCRSWRDDYVGNVPLVLRPKNTEEVAEIVRLCASMNIAIVPQGGNTGLTGGSQPHNDMREIILSTSRLNKVRDINVTNDTITVEAGVVLKQIQELAEENDRLFPLSLGAEGSCQIGGNLSTNAGGTQVLRYGNTRALVLGLEVVLANGEVWQGLGELRKDNTGYDMKHLFIGSEGTLGIITAAVLRLFPKSTAHETAWLGVKSPEHAVRLLGHIKSSMGDLISGFELMQRKIIEFVIERLPEHNDPLESVHPWYVLCEVSAQGNPDVLSESFSNVLEKAMELGLVDDAIIALSGMQSERFWKMREDIAEAQKLVGVSIKHDISVPISKIAEFIERANSALLAVYPDIQLCAFGHVGDGNIHYNPMQPKEWTKTLSFHSERKVINRLVHDIVFDLGGSISAEHGIGQLRLTENIYYKSQTELDMMRAVKIALDPQNIMNPEKVLLL